MSFEIQVEPTRNSAEKVAVITATTALLREIRDVYRAVQRMCETLRLDELLTALAAWRDGSPPPDFEDHLLRARQVLPGTAAELDRFRCEIQKMDARTEGLASEARRLQDVGLLRGVKEVEGMQAAADRALEWSAGRSRQLLSALVEIA